MVFKFLIRELRTITVEPVVFFYAFAQTLLGGAQVNTNLLIWKMCHLELNYSVEICDDLSNENNTDVAETVTKHVNDFQMVSQWIQSVPLVVFSLIAGALSDKFGRKPLIFMPLFGNLISYGVYVLNYWFIETLPIEFFYLGNFGSFLGGYAVYYLGIYSFGTNVTKQEERSYRLARLDGIETLSAVFGNLLSPVVFNKLGYYGSYVTSFVIESAAVLYLVFFVSEPLSAETDTPEKEKQSNFVSALANAVKTPFVGMWEMFSKERTSLLKFIIFLQFLWFGIYWLAIEIKIILYLYFLLVFKEYDETDFAIFTVAINICNVICLMFIIPFMSQTLKIHDAMMIFIILVFEVISFVVTPFCNELWQFYLAQGIGSMGYCKFSIVRSLLSRCIGSHEVGKAFSILAVTAALMPVAGNPMFRKLFNLTIDTIPGSIFFLAAALSAVAAVGNLFLYAKRGEMKTGEEEAALELKKFEALDETISHM